jgi:predicted membrane protein
MKTKALRILGVILLMATIVKGQEFKVSKSTGKLVIKDVNHVSIEGYNGNEIVFTSLDGPSEKDQRAEGLRAVNSLGLEDNTGFGLSVQDKGATIEVYQLKKMDGPRVKIMVPKGVSISVNHNSPHGDDIKIKNVESEIEVSTLHNGVTLENVTGPLTIKTIHGEIEAVFGANIKSPISIASIHGLIDITIPVATKLNVNMAVNYGEIFVDPAIKIELQEKSDMVRYGSSKVKGTVNGGGIELGLTSSHGNIYLRKK